MKKFVYILCLLSIVPAGCNFFRAPGKDKCEKIISREKMTDIMAEVYLLEAYFQEANIGGSRLTDTVIMLYGGLFEKYGTDYREFDAALSCYLLNERDMLLIHEDILQRFSILEGELMESHSKREARHLHAMTPGFPPPFHETNDRILQKDWWAGTHTVDITAYHYVMIRKDSPEVHHQPDGE